MNYNVLNWNEASKFKNHSGTKFLKNIDFNESSVYKLKDSSFLIMPLNPFGKSLKTKNKELIEMWESQKYFPTNEIVNNFYFKNKLLIENLNVNRSKLREDLFNYIYGKRRDPLLSINSNMIDNIYKSLNDKKVLNRFKLNFIVLVCDYLSINNSKYKIGILEQKQLLNPINSIVLSLDSELKYYCSIEECVFGSYGYLGMRGIENIIKDFKKRPSESDTLRLLE